MNNSWCWSTLILLFDWQAEDASSTINKSQNLSHFIEINSKKVLCVVICSYCHRLNQTLQH